MRLCQLISEQYLEWLSVSYSSLVLLSQYPKTLLIQQTSPDYQLPSSALSQYSSQSEVSFLRPLWSREDKLTLADNSRRQENTMGCTFVSFFSEDKPEVAT